MSSKLYEKGNKEYILGRSALLILAILVAVGLWLRVRNLGHLSLLADEGIEALAVEGILQHGAPKVESGLVYVRWPLYLYIQAALAWLFELNEFWLRLPSAVFGALAIVPAYILGRDLFDRPVGLLVATILAFSVWEIELSRYARGYTAFQFFFLVCLIPFYHGFMLGKNRYKVWFMVAAIVTLFTHELSDLLVVLFAIPVLSPALGLAKKLRSVAWGGGVAAMVVARKKLIGFWLPDHLTEVQMEPEGAVNEITSALGLPSLRLPETGYFLQVFQEDTLIVYTLGILTVLVTLYLAYFSYRYKTYIRSFISILIIWSAFLCQFMISFILIFSYFIFFREDYRSVKGANVFACIMFSLFLLVSWFILTSNEFQDTSYVIIVKSLFSFPDLYDYMLDWLLDGWPLMLMLLIAGSFLLFVRHLKNPNRVESIFILGALYITALAASLFDAFEVSRYFFHLYPLIVAISSWIVYVSVTYVFSMISLSGGGKPWMVALVCIPILMFASQDAYPTRAWNIGERTYKSQIDPYRGSVSWEFYAGFHQDLKHPSLYVRRNSTNQDEIISLEPPHMSAIYQYYIGEVDYFLASSENIHKYSLISENHNNKRDLIHYITGSKILTDKKGMRSVIEEAQGTVWLMADIRMLDKNNPIYLPETSNYLENLRRKYGLQYIGNDSTMCVLKIE